MRRFGVELTITALATGNVASVLLLQFFVLTVIGPSRETDAYFAAATLPAVVVGVCGVILPAILVPRWAPASRRQQGEECLTVLVAIGIGATVLALAVACVSDGLFRFAFRGFGSVDAALGIRLLRVQLPGMVASLGVAVISALLAARARFVALEVANLAVALIALGVLVAGLPRFGIILAAWVASLRPVVLLLVLLPAIGTLSISAGAWSRLRHMFEPAGRLVAANAYYKSEMFVDRYLLSAAPAGDLSLYGIANQAFVSASAILGKVWGSNVVPSLARRATALDRDGFWGVYRRNLLINVAVSSAVAILVLLIGENILQFLLRPTSVDPDAAHRLWVMLVLMSGVLIGGSAGALLSGAFYAIGDTLTPTIMSVATFTVFIVIRLVGFHEFGMEGLCMAVTAYYMLNAVLLALLLPTSVRRHWGK